MRFLIFDMDGVLVDTCGLHARAYRDLWERCGVAGLIESETATAGQSDRSCNTPACLNDFCGLSAFLFQVSDGLA